MNRRYRRTTTLAGRGLAAIALLSTALGLGAIARPPAAWAQSTSWTGTVGDWGSSANWSNGVPTAGVDVVVPFNGTPTVTQSGEACRNLTTGVSAGGSTLRIQTGSLSVSDRLWIASSQAATMLQTFGALTVGDFVLGSATGPGAVTMSGGSFTAGTATIGDTNALGTGTFSMTAGNPVCTFSTSLLVLKGGSFVCGAGGLNVGTAAGEGAVIEGAFALENAPAITMKRFTMFGTGTLSILVGPTGVSRINVDGTATLAGTLLVNDVLAPNGSYEVVRATTLQGTFASVFLPPNWSWRTQGASMFITKGEVPVKAVTWGEVKSGYTEK